MNLGDVNDYYSEFARKKMCIRDRRCVINNLGCSAVGLRCGHSNSVFNFCNAEIAVNAYFENNLPLVVVYRNGCLLYTSRKSQKGY